MQRNFFRGTFCVGEKKINSFEECIGKRISECPKQKRRRAAQKQNNNIQNLRISWRRTPLLYTFVSFAVLSMYNCRLSATEVYNNNNAKWTLRKRTGNKRLEETKTIQCLSRIGISNIYFFCCYCCCWCRHRQCLRRRRRPQRKNNE